MEYANLEEIKSVNLIDWKEFKNLLYTNAFTRTRVMSTSLYAGYQLKSEAQNEHKFMLTSLKVVCANYFLTASQLHSLQPRQKRQGNSSPITIVSRLRPGKTRSYNDVIQAN